MIPKHHKVPFSWPIAFDLRGFLVLSEGRGSLGTRSCLKSKIFFVGDILYLCGMDNRLTRRREMLYTLEEVASELGCSVREVEELEESFLSPLQKAYLNLLRYDIGFYPHRKKRQRLLATMGESKG